MIKVADLPIAAIVRIAKKNGAERVGHDGAAALGKRAEEYIGELAREAQVNALLSRRKTIRQEDISLAAKSM